MGRRNLIGPFKVLNSVDISTDQLQSVPSTIDQIDRVEIEIEWTGSSPDGSITVECAYFDPKTLTYSTWETLNFGSTIAISGASGSHTLLMNEKPPGNKLRVRYTSVSGSGTLTATLLAYNVGA